MSCGVIVKVGWMDKVVASFWPHFNVTIVENLFSSVNTANRPQLSLIEIQSVSSLLDNINGRYRHNRFLLHNISPKLLMYQLYFTKRGSQCKTEICREDRQMQTTKTVSRNEHANETTTTTTKKGPRTASMTQLMNPPPPGPTTHVDLRCFKWKNILRVSCVAASFLSSSVRFYIGATPASQSPLTSTVTLHP